MRTGELYSWVCCKVAVLPCEGLNVDLFSYGFPDGSVVKESANEGATRDESSIPGSGRSPRGGNGNLQYSCPENPVDRGAWQATDHGVAKELDVTEHSTDLLYSSCSFPRPIQLLYCGI